MLRVICETLGDGEWLNEFTVFNLDLPIRPTLAESYSCYIRKDQRKTGSVYTNDQDLIRGMCQKLCPSPQNTFLDPAMGTGAFLLILAKEFKVPPQNLFGIDIDPYAIEVAILTFMIEFGWSLDLLKSQFRCLDSLQDDLSFLPLINFVVGNPPWLTLKAPLPCSIPLRARLRERAVPYVPKSYSLGQQCSLQLLFTYLALHLATHGIALILPMGIIENKDSQDLMELLRSWWDFDVQKFDSREFFPSIMIQTFITLVGTRRIEPLSVEPKEDIPKSDLGGWVKKTRKGGQHVVYGIEKYVISDSQSSATPYRMVVAAMIQPFRLDLEVDSFYSSLEYRTNYPTILMPISPPTTLSTGLRNFRAVCLTRDSGLRWDDRIRSFEFEECDWRLFFALAFFNSPVFTRWLSTRTDRHFLSVDFLKTFPVPSEPTLEIMEVSEIARLFHENGTSSGLWEKMNDRLERIYSNLVKAPEPKLKVGNWARGTRAGPQRMAWGVAKYTISDSQSSETPYRMILASMITPFHIDLEHKSRVYSSLKIPTLHPMIIFPMQPPFNSSGERNIRAVGLNSDRNLSWDNRMRGMVFEECDWRFFFVLALLNSPLIGRWLAKRTDRHFFSIEHIKTFPVPLEPTLEIMEVSEIARHFHENGTSTGLWGEMNDRLERIYSGLLQGSQ